MKEDFTGEELQKAASVMQGLKAAWGTAKKLAPQFMSGAKGGLKSPLKSVKGLKRTAQNNRFSQASAERKARILGRAAGVAAYPAGAAAAGYGAAKLNKEGSDESPLIETAKAINKALDN